MVVTTDNDNTLGVIPQEEQQRIASSIQMIASTAYGTVPYARSMGLRNILPRNNSEMEKNEYASDLTEAVEAWEDRVSVKEVEVAEDGETKVVIDYVE